MLTEIFFHDNAGDMARFNERRPAVVEAISRTICEWFGVAYPEIPPDPNAVRIYVGGIMLPGIIIDGVTYAPARKLAEALGCRVNWDEATRTVTII